jgi:hypothetical protein
MSNKINFTYDGKDYCLEFTRKTVRQMEDSGFVAARVTEAPMTILPDLFAGAFLANHKFTKRETIDEIFSKMTDKRMLIDTLSKMYNEPLATLLEEDGGEGNGISWTTE